MRFGVARAKYKLFGRAAGAVVLLACLFACSSDNRNEELIAAIIERKGLPLVQERLAAVEDLNFYHRTQPRLGGGYVYYSPLTAAIAAYVGDEESLDVIALLLKHGADPNFSDPQQGGRDPDDFFYSPLETTSLIAPVHPDNKIIELLAMHGLKVKVGEGGLSLAYLLTLDSSTQKRLFPSGLPVNRQDEAGRTALMLAAGAAGRCADQATVLRLLEAGADQRLEDREGKSALVHSILATSSCATRDAPQIRVALKQVLSASGGRYVLTRAVQNGDRELFERWYPKVEGNAKQGLLNEMMLVAVNKRRQDDEVITWLDYLVALGADVHAVVPEHRPPSLEHALVFNNLDEPLRLKIQLLLGFE